MDIATQTLEAPQESPQGKVALTPPTSEEWNKKDGCTSDLSDIDLDEDFSGEIEPDHYFEDGKIPVFKPTMDQFRSFKNFISKIDKYGMKSGIVKVIPPKEWTDALPALDEAVKSIKVKNPITQEFAGTHGTYTQANIEKQRSYNLPQWKALTEESQHQPPAKRGERRRNQIKPIRPVVPRAKARPTDSDGQSQKKRGPGRPRKHHNKKKDINATSQTSPAFEEQANGIQEPPTPMTPSSPNDQPNEAKHFDEAYLENESHEKQCSSENTGRSRRTQDLVIKSKSISERRKYNRQETAESVDEGAFEGFDYRFYGHEEFTAERCRELETLYWKSLTFAPPMYGADMPGSLFDDSTTSWNVAKLENLLDVLGQKVPGVNTAYLYLGMWKATFAWHLEDVDLYSINYIHFGAPKQWYSISQEDARRFENAMKSVWPTDAKNCSQFLRHKTYLISPALLQSQFNIRVNRLVHYEGEFVITFPYGYHSGYNLGYNCAESVNFATEAWLEYGKIAKKCDCEADSVWVNVEEIERKLRGEPTPEYYEETDDDDNEIMDGRCLGFPVLPSPPASILGRCKQLNRKRKWENTSESMQKKTKKIKIRVKSEMTDSCVLCPNEVSAEPLIRTESGLRTHRNCALFTPETYLSEDENGLEIVRNICNIDKARLDLKCSYCRSKKGACFQCSYRKCTRAFHATCAAPAGVQVDHGHVPVYGNDGTEYLGEAYDFRCRFHRAKRSKTSTCDSLESIDSIHDAARLLTPNQTAQFQYLQGEIFAGVIIENRISERTLIVDILPHGDQVEVDWKWLLKLDPSDSHLPRPSKYAKPLPSHMSKHIAHSHNLEFGLPLPDDPFGDPQFALKWAEFNAGPPTHNSLQVKADMGKSGQIWYYLGERSTEARAQYTENPSNRCPNQAANFLESVRVAVKSDSIQSHHPVDVGVSLSPESFICYGSKISSQHPYASASQNWSAIQRTEKHNQKIDILQGNSSAESGMVECSTKLQNSLHSNQSIPRVHPAPDTSEIQGGITQSTLTKDHIKFFTMNSSSEPTLGRSLVDSSGNCLVEAHRSSALRGLSQPCQSTEIQPSTLTASQRTLLDQYYGSISVRGGANEVATRLEGNVQSAIKPHQRLAGMSNADLAGKGMLWNISQCLTAPRSAYLGHVARYPYLLNSLLRQPRTYTSPYGYGGDRRDC